LGSPLSPCTILPNLTGGSWLALYEWNINRSRYNRTYWTAQSGEITSCAQTGAYYRILSLLFREKSVCRAESVAVRRVL
jgi:hypothetical protein